MIDQTRPEATRRRRSLWACWRGGAGLLLALALLTLLFRAPAATAQTAIQATQSAAQIDFPRAVTFTLSAESSAAPITEVKLLYGATRSESLIVVDAQFAAGQRIQARHELDTQVIYFPPGADLTYRWLIRDAAGNELTTPPQTLVYHDQRFAWEERTERGVTVFWYRGGAAFGEELIQTATRTLDRLQAEIGATVSDPVKIYIYANSRDMRGALRSNEVEWVGGQAWPGLGLIIGAIEPGDRAEVRRLIPHELSHQVLHQAVANPYGGLPVWFDEGLAVYNQEIADADFDGLVADAARANRLIPLEALASSFPADPNQARLSYAQSRSVVAYIIATYGVEPVQELVAAFRAALPVEEALQTALGLSVAELDAEWQATLPAPRAVPTVAPTPAVAPAERFAGAPVLPPGVAPPAAPLALPALPGWAGLTLALLCCTGLILLAGAALLVGLRMFGIDKRV